MIREIVTIDEELCDGCGLCVPECHEGAIKIIDGKAKLIADNLCDGLGACLGHCPQDAIKVERREAEVFDEAAVAARLGSSPEHPPAQAPAPSEPPMCPSARLSTFQPPAPPAGGGCPGSRVAKFGPGGDGPSETSASPHVAGPGQPSELIHWPVQLKLLPPTAPVLQNARLLVCVDCVPFAYADFHSQMLRDHAVVIACPKLDDTTGYVEKLTEMFRVSDFRDVSVARMEVPCCSGILQTVVEARRRAGVNVEITDIVVGIRGQILSRRQYAANAAAPSKT